MAGTIYNHENVTEHLNPVSMESGLDGRNNLYDRMTKRLDIVLVSMESGLDGRNNWLRLWRLLYRTWSLNGVRPRWPEQCDFGETDVSNHTVSMESGLDGRNNLWTSVSRQGGSCCLNGVRPRWPEQSSRSSTAPSRSRRLNGVRPRWPEQSYYRRALERLFRSQWSPA